MKELGRYEKVLHRCQQHIIMRYPYLRRAMARVSLQLCEVGYYSEQEDTLATDGEYIFVSTQLCDRYSNNIVRLSAMIIHSLYHCIYGHTVLANTDKNSALWNYACDIFVYIKMHNRGIALEGINCNITRLAGQISPQLTALRADGIYDMLSQDMQLEQLAVDQHYMWGMGGGIELDYSIGALQSKRRTRARNNISQSQWIDVVQSIELDDIQPIHMPDYRDVVSLLARDYHLHDKLKRFCTYIDMGGDNLEEFDYIYYMYGLENFDNMPLIDSCESQLVHSLQNIVVVLDTSQSITRDVFARYTRIVYSIFRYFDSSRRFNMILLQADDRVRKTQHIDSLDELDSYFRHIRMRGRGNTDFATVIDYVSANVDSVKGMLYLSDGYSRFTDLPPDYPLMMIFDENADNRYTVPQWVQTYTVTKESI